MKAATQKPSLSKRLADLREYLKRYRSSHSDEFSKAPVLFLLALFIAGTIWDGVRIGHLAGSFLISALILFIFYKDIRRYKPVYLKNYKMLLLLCVLITGTLILCRTFGRFPPGIEYRIVPVPGIEQGGVLHVRGPNLMQGYFFHESPGVMQAPRSEVGVGWYNTGDVVSVDEDGFVTVHGRIKRFAKIAGEMVSLERVEYIAYHASPGSKHAAVVEMTRSGESTVLLTTDPVLDRVALLHTARRINAQDLAVARRVLRVDTLPLLGSGKIDYVTLQNWTVP